MSKAGKVRLVVGLALLAAVAGMAAIVKQEKHTAGAQNVRTPSTVTETESDTPPALPRLVDLGAGKCIPCKMMAPILEELKAELAGRLQVDFIDVWENPDAGKEYRIRLIPTQIFYDAAGNELYRHEGFMSKEDILAKWKEFGVDLAVPSGAPGEE